MIHRKCYKDYTRICSKRPSDGSNIDLHNENEAKSNNLYSFVSHHVIGCMQTASMKLLTDIYGYDGDDTRLRNKVKKKLEEKFPEELLFVSVSYHQSMLVISQKVLTNSMLSMFTNESKDFIIIEAANILQGTIKDFIDNAADLPWPPTSAPLMERQPPGILNDFITKVMHDQSSYHAMGYNTAAIAKSIADDLIFGYSSGKFMTRKHVVLGVRLHNMTS